MSIKFKTEVSIYVPGRGFALVVWANFNFSNYIQHPVQLHLQDHSLCPGVLVSSHLSSPTNDQSGQKWGLFVRSDEIKNPKETTIVAIELQDE